MPKTQEEKDKKFETQVNKARDGLIGIVLLVALVGFMLDIFSPASPTPYKENTSSYNTKKPKPEQKDQLILKSSRSKVEHGYLTVSGEVQNNTSKKMENVVVKVITYDAQGGVISVHDAMIDYDPILMGQTSPFKAMGKHNPATKRTKIEFAYMFGGKIPSIRR